MFKWLFGNTRNAVAPIVEHDNRYAPWNQPNAFKVTERGCSKAYGFAINFKTIREAYEFQQDLGWNHAGKFIEVGRKVAHGSQDPFRVVLNVYDDELAVLLRLTYF